MCMISTRQVFDNLRKVVPVIRFARRTEVEKYLKMYNIDLDSGEYRCAVCGERVTRENVGMLVSDGSKVILVCSKPSCMAKADFLRLYEHL